MLSNCLKCPKNTESKNPKVVRTKKRKNNARPVCKKNSCVTIARLHEAYFATGMGSCMQVYGRV